MVTAQPSPGTGCRRHAASTPGRLGRGGRRPRRPCQVFHSNALELAVGHLTAIQRMVHGRAELQRAVFVQPVVGDGPPSGNPGCWLPAAPARPTTRMSWGDRPSDFAVSTNPDFMYSTAPR